MATRTQKKINKMTLKETQAEHTKLMSQGHFKMDRTLKLAKHIEVLANF